MTVPATSSSQVPWWDPVFAAEWNHMLKESNLGDGFGADRLMLRDTVRAKRLYNHWRVQADRSGGCSDYGVKLFPLLKCYQKRECFAVGRYRSGQIVQILTRKVPIQIAPIRSFSLTRRTRLPLSLNLPTFVCISGLGNGF
jgi:hypothetical protein